MTIQKVQENTVPMSRGQESTGMSFRKHKRIKQKDKKKYIREHKKLGKMSEKN